LALGVYVTEQLLAPDAGNGHLAELNVPLSPRSFVKVTMPVGRPRPPGSDTVAVQVEA
jgi:hypothetical protein